MVGKPKINDRKKHFNFVKRLNEEPALLRRFLDDPITVLAEEGGTELEPADARELEKAVNYLKSDVLHIFEIPQGSSEFLKRIHWGLDARGGRPRIVIDMRGI